MEDFKKQLDKGNLIKSEGPGPFITKQIYRSVGGKTFVWESRLHRKGISAGTVRDIETFGKACRRGFSQVNKMNWWIAVVFAIGSSFFMAGSILSLSPTLAKYFALDNTEVNAVFFIGSIPFTTAAFLQFYQAAKATQSLNRDKPKHFRQTRWGMYLTSVAWLSAGLQFVGTLLFNINTFDGMNDQMDWLQNDLKVWVPDIIGSVFFLASGYLAFIETAHAFWKWDTKNISWWVVFINLLGCIAFLLSAFYSFVYAAGSSNFNIEISLIFTLMGAMFFFVGSLSMLPEAGMESSGSKQ